ncbi:OmpH family outer membrane protein [Aureivirga marina]|uniref:OmpH family outer membrane protein n=1 Tax=Aureivirga marina TaxID=1182451 RepID=UPI0018CACBFD|nr:OmpH family outer membrane protein [Aureivirga marina]
MIKKVLLTFIIVISSTVVFAQKPQKIAYIDMEYILQNVPEYTKAQGQLDEKIQSWRQKLEKKNEEISVMKTELNNERALLTEDLIEEREEDIQILLEEYKKMENDYFGPEGDLFLLRRQLVKPIQDLIFNSVQEIAKRKKYDIVFDNSQDLIMLYTNKKYDISELVIQSISRNKKKKAVEDKRNAIKAKQAKAKSNGGLSPEAAAKAQAREDAKKKRQEELQERIRKQKEAREKKREEMKKAIEAKKQARLKKQEELRKKREEAQKAREEQAKQANDDK